MSHYVSLANFDYLGKEVVDGLREVVGSEIPGLIVVDAEDGPKVPMSGVVAGLLTFVPEGYESLVADVVKRWADELSESSILDLEGLRLESYEGPAPLEEWEAYDPPEGTRGWLLKGLRKAEALLRSGRFPRWEVGVAILLERVEHDLGTLQEARSVRDVALALLGAAFQIGCQPFPERGGLN